MEISQICFLPCTKVEAKNAAHAAIQRNYVRYIQPTPSSCLNWKIHSAEMTCVCPILLPMAHILWLLPSRRSWTWYYSWHSLGEPKMPATQEILKKHAIFCIGFDWLACQKAFEIPKFIDYLIYDYLPSAIWNGSLSGLAAPPSHESTPGNLMLRCPVALLCPPPNQDAKTQRNSKATVRYSPCI